VACPLAVLSFIPRAPSPPHWPWACGPVVCPAVVPLPGSEACGMSINQPALVTTPATTRACPVDHGGSAAAQWPGCSGR